MKFRNLGLASAIMFLSAPAWADVTGKWTASVDGPMGGDPIQLEFDLTADGSDLSGSVGVGGMPIGEISDGKVDGNDVTFKLAMPAMGGPGGGGGGEGITIDYVGTVEGDEMELVSTFPAGPGGEPMVTELTAKRAN